MKFKTIFIFFNSILIFSFFFIFFMPFFIIGQEYALQFWNQNWYIALLFLIVVGGMNGYFLRNWKLFSLMEEENWKGIQKYLEEKINEGKRISEQEARILMNTYMVLGQAEKLLELSKVLQTSSPRLFRNLAVELGVPYLLRSDPEGLANYYKPLYTEKQVKKQNWARFSWALALLFAHRFSEARVELETFQVPSEEPILFLLSAYLLSTLKGEDAAEQRVLHEQCDWFRSKYSPKQWARYVDGFKENLMVLVLSKFIQDATAWMYSKSEVTHGS
ncbi:MAG: hypothetical protein N2442_05580 [Spirochaetes bacterium]|nr:hypothetical protein [Spirochaetota bacterium]